MPEHVVLVWLQCLCLSTVESSAWWVDWRCTQGDVSPSLLLTRVAENTLAFMVPSLACWRFVGALLAGERILHSCLQDCQQEESEAGTLCRAEGPLGTFPAASGLSPARTQPLIRLLMESITKKMPATRDTMLAGNWNCSEQMEPRELLQWEGQEGWDPLLSRAVKDQDAASCSTGEAPRSSVLQQSQFTEIPEGQGRACAS